METKNKQSSGSRMGCISFLLGCFIVAWCLFHKEIDSEAVLIFFLLFVLGL